MHDDDVYIAVSGHVEVFIHLSSASVPSNEVASHGHCRRPTTARQDHTTGFISATKHHLASSQTGACQLARYDIIIVFDKNTNTKLVWPSFHIFLTQCFVIITRVVCQKIIRCLVMFWEVFFLLEFLRYFVFYCSAFSRVYRVAQKN